MSPDGPVAVLGGGAWGTALANAVAESGREAVLWFRDPDSAERVRAARENARHLPGVPLRDGVRPTADEGALAGATVVLAAVPAQVLRPVLARLRPSLPGAAPTVICAKGIERGSGAFLSDVARAVRPEAPVAVLSGPSFAADVARGLPTAVTLACLDEARAARLAAELSGRSLRVYHTGDVRGVEIGGAAKNVLAIAAGIVDGRGLGESAKAALVARGFAELCRFAAAEGARPETPMGLSGLGDVVLTCGSAQSRNYALGRRIGRGEGGAGPGEGPLAEGAWTAEALVARARARRVEMPVAEAVAAVLRGEIGVDGATDALMARPLRAEA